jgi:tetratricopeptide (TPR) repeat protein
MCGTCDYAIPTAVLKTLRDEVLNEVARISQSGTLSPQERTLLRIIVERTLDGDTSQLYQKALADDLAIPNPKQVGVVATRIRAKLADFYAGAATDAPLQIALSDRGYEAFISYRQAAIALSERAQLAVANAKAALDQRTLPGAAAALKHLTSALDLEPGHPLLLALKALCHATRALYGTYPRADLEAADAIVSATPPSEPRPWESWFAQGCVRMALHWDWPAAEAAFDRAIALSGGAARRLPWYTAFLASQGRAPEAVPLLRTAVGQAHDSPIVRADLAINQIFAGQYADAQDTIDTAFALFGERTHYLLHVHRAILHEATGTPAAAARVIGQVPLTWPQTTITLGLRALFSGLAGDRRTARRHFAKLRAGRLLTGHHYIPAGQLCIAALGAGDPDAAVAWLREGAVVERDPNLVLTNVYPFFRHLHGHAGFQAFVRDTMRLQLPPS